MSVSVQTVTIGEWRVLAAILHRARHDATGSAELADGDVELSLLQVLRVDGAARAAAGCAECHVAALRESRPALIAKITLLHFSSLYFTALQVK